MNFNILGIGLPQIAIVLVLSLVLFGPKQMMQYAYQAGRFLAKARAMWEEAARTMQQEMQNSGLDLKEFQDLKTGLQKDITTAVNIPPFGAVTGAMSNGNGANGSSVLPTPTAAETIMSQSEPPAVPLPVSAPEGVPPAAIPSLDLSEDHPDPVPPVESTDQSKKYDAWLLN